MWIISMNRQYKFSSNLANPIQSFIKFNRDIGRKYDEYERILYKYDQFNLLQSNRSYLDKEDVDRFTSMRPNIKVGTQLACITVLSQFGKYLVRNGSSSYVCSTRYNAGCASRYRPYIFTRRQIAQIFNIVDNIPKQNRTTRALVFYPAIFRLLYGCGLRVSEALNLRVCDVDLHNCLITAENTKNGRVRTIPAHSSVIRRMTVFKEQAHPVPNPNEFFFKSVFQDRYDSSTVYTYFRNVIWKCGISHSGRRKGGPRVHDLRHTFCVHCLRQFVERGEDVAVALPILSSYLGHSSLHSTEYYLRLTAEVFPEIAQNMEKHLNYFNRTEE